MLLWDKTDFLNAFGNSTRVFPSFTALSVLALMWLFKLFLVPLRILWYKVNVYTRLKWVSRKVFE